MLTGSLLLVLAGIAYNHATGRRYPHAQQPAAPAASRAPGMRLSAEDLDAALARYNQVLDVSRDDLEDLLHEAEQNAYRRSLGALRCADVMTTPPVTVSAATALADARRLMRERRIKALPVVDARGAILGIVTAANLADGAETRIARGRVGERLRGMLGRWRPAAPEPEGVIGDVMTRTVRVSSADRFVVDLLPLFAAGGHHHLPIIDAERRVVGVITQSDLVRTLARSLALVDGAR
ncbi:CBS domain-containing protein [Piscinibacter koreensis]|uniref:CBS domain-containing protein n=1 Tax=Piscinibacter koreensis TaxID=2742824 RepID=UPI0031586527